MGLVEKKFITTDNAANMVKTILNLGWKHYGCFGHTLNLVMQNGSTTDAHTL